MSPLPEYESRQSQQTIVDQWVASLHQPSYEPGLPFSLLAYPYLHECLGEPGFIRKRNERERMRVRNVNEGYASLRDHLPLEPTDKRLSKVETLRGAIRYIKLLESLLENNDTDNDEKKQDLNDRKDENNNTISENTSNDNKYKSNRTTTTFICSSDLRKHSTESGENSDYGNISC